MPAPASVDSFLELVGKSGLVEEDRLRAFVQQSGGLSTQPRPLAARLIAAGLLTQFQAEQLLLGKHRGFTIGKYKVLERIGAGGHGNVYLCEHVVVKRRVAVKVLPTARSDNPAALARFYREARAAGALDHPNLVKAHDVDRDNGLHFLVMDYVDGSSLQQIVARFGPLSVERAAHYIRQAAQGLHAAHLAGLVHRDIKPANILLDRQGLIRVLDLGLARFFRDNEDPLTLKYDSNSVLGTADYVAPEQALNSHEVDIRADIYSLGATFYFLLVGHSLFPKGQVTQKLIWHQTRRPTPLRQLRPEVPEELAAVVERMIEKDPNRRYQTPAELSEALAAWTETPIALPTDVEMPRLSPAARAAAVAEMDSGSNLPRGLPSTPRVPGSSLPPRPLSLAPAAELVPGACASLPRILSEPALSPPGNEPGASVEDSPLSFAPAVPQAGASSSTFRRRIFTWILFLVTATLTGVGLRWINLSSLISSLTEAAPTSSQQPPASAETSEGISESPRP